MLLARSIRWRERGAAMVGVIPGDAVMHERPVGRGYVQLEATEAMPWPGMTGAAGSVRGHEFHHSSLENLAPGTRFAWHVKRGHGVDGQHDGICIHRVLANYAHLRGGAGSDWPQHFLACLRAARDGDARRAGTARAAPLAVAA